MLKDVIALHPGEWQLLHRFDASSVADGQTRPPPFLLVRRGVHGEGTCFFHAVAASLNYRNILGMDVVQDNAKIQQAGLDLRSKFNVWGRKAGLSDDVLVILRDPTAWSESRVVEFVSALFGLDFLFFDTKDASKKWACERFGGQSKYERKRLVMLIHWCQKNHFEALGLLKGGDVGAKTVDVQFVFDPDSDEDRPFLNRIQADFKHSCPGPKNFFT